MTAGDIVVISEEAGGRKGNYLDGTGDFVQHNAHGVARVAGNDTSGCYTAWIYVDNLTGTYGILGGGDNSGAAEHFHISIVAGKIQVHLRPAAAISFTVIETTAVINTREWTHIAVNHTGVRPDIYVNGVVSAMTDSVSTDLTDWYDELPDVDEFVIGAKTINNVESTNFLGAIGQVKYFDEGLTAEDIMYEFNGDTNPRASILAAALQFNITMESDGITDAGLGLDNGTLTGNAYYGGLISDWSYHLNFDGHITGHAAEFMNTFIDGSKYVSVLKKGD